MQTHEGGHFGASLDEDMQLMVLAAGGDATAFAKLYKKYAPIITAYIISRNGCGTSVEDLVQDVFSRLWQNRKQFRGDSAVRTYIFGIVKNVLSDNQRHLSKQMVTVDAFCLEYLSIRPDGSSEPDAELRQAEIKKAVEQAIGRLTAKQRQAIRLFYFKGMTCLRVMANRANCSTEAFRSTLRQARRNLRQLLSNLEP